VYPVSDKLNKAVRYTHTIVSAVHVYSPDGELIKDDLKVEAGFVRVDDNREIRRRFTARLMDYTGDLTPREVYDIFHPLARNEFHVFRGVRFDDDTVELVPQGIFDMADVNISDSREGYFLEVVGYDRARDVTRRRFVGNYVVPVASNYGIAIQDMISTMRPGTQFDFTPTNFLTPQLVFGGSGDTGGGNAWSAGQRMAESIGMDLYFGVDGICYLRPVPSLSNNFIHFHYHESDDGPNQVLFVDRRLSDDEAFNHVVVRGESTSNEEPVKGEAVDDDPTSPTYIHGPYGDIPTFMSSPYVRSEAQANELARARLHQVLGIEETIRLISIVHPGHEIGDVIHIWRERTGVDANYIIDQFTMPLESTQALNIGVRSKRSK